MTPQTRTPRARTPRARSSAAKAPTIPGISNSQPSCSAATTSAMRARSKPSTTMTLPPDISVPSDHSAAPMW